VARWRRPGVEEILWVFLLLEAIGDLCSWLSHSPDQRNPLASFLIVGFFTWRVSRGGRISRMLLIISTGWSYAGAALDLARLWNPAVVAWLIVSAAQFALLVSAPVYWRTRPIPYTVRMPGWTRFARLPPIWLLLPWGLLAGVLVTLICLGHMDSGPVAGCQATASNSCTALFDGYPLTWLTTDQFAPLIDKGALVKDCVQWSLVSISVLYLLTWKRVTAGTPEYEPSA
jgi:hypothetical protein